MSAGPSPADVIAAIERELRVAASGDGYEPRPVAEQLYRLAAKSLAAALAAGPPSVDWTGAWTELNGYVQEACDDGGQIDPADMRAYLRELKRKAMAPVRDWMAVRTSNKENQ